LDQDFYEDIFEELSKYGEIENLNVCDNLADHMVTKKVSLLAECLNMPVCRYQ
jgi:Flp pilus assembly CpaF family ATPase